MSWDPHHLPRSEGRTFAVTGATGGIGYFAAEQLAATGAHVVLASRSQQKLDRAATSIRTHVPDADLTTVVVDLASLASVRRAAEQIEHLDGIFLNGGSMAIRRLVTTEDGLPELLATHVVANVALAGLLLPKLIAAGTPDRHSRLVHASTGFVARTTIDVSDVTAAQRGYYRTYTGAKTATEVYAHELDRRLRAAGVPVDSILTVPGVGVDAKTPAREGVYDPRTQKRRNPFTPWAQGKDAAAWAGVRGLLDPTLVGGQLVGPENGRRGVPVVKPLNAHTVASNPVNERTWRALHDLAGVREPDFGATISA